jgi:hypothetical protein
LESLSIITLAKNLRSKKRILKSLKILQTKKEEPAGFNDKSVQSSCLKSTQDHRSKIESNSQYQNKKNSKYQQQKKNLSSLERI